jgi:hypothetical protein
MKYLKKTFKDEPCLNDEKYIEKCLLFKLITAGHIDLFKLLVEIYKPNLIEHVIKNCYSHSRSKNVYKLKYNMYKKLDRDTLMYIFDNMKLYDNLDSFHQFYCRDTSFPELDEMYTTLFKRKDSQLLLFIDNIVGENLDGNFLLRLYGQ